jgi:ferredoxin
MATYITTDCINCGACEPECPNEAISEGDDIYVIDPELCTECVGFYDHEACQAVCPVECCLPDPNHPEKEGELIARALDLHPDDGELKKRADVDNFPSRFRKLAQAMARVRRRRPIASAPRRGRAVFAPRRWGALLASASLGACGGSSPLLHPAHVEPQGTVVAGAGVSGQLTLGGAEQAAIDAQAASVEGAVPSDPRTYRRGAIALASFAPGADPWVGARVGLGGQNEAGLTYSGRSIRVDARHAFGDERWALSAGLGAHGVLRQRNDEPALRNLDLNEVNGYGFDLPLLAGWQSDAGLVRAWGGLRVGYERLNGRVGLGEPDPVSLSAWRAWGGGLVGLAMGFRHVYVALELDAAYHTAKGKLGGEGGYSIDGLTLAPGGALLGRF